MFSFFNSEKASLVNVHRVDRKNVGDMASSPLNYFDFPSSKRIDIMSIKKARQLDRHVIVGGGGLLARSYFDSQMEFVAANTKGKLISWGIGHNGYEDISSSSISYPRYMDRFDLHGIRDYDKGYHYVPCASCMSHCFDSSPEVRHDFVIYEHPRRKIDIDENFPRLNNTETSLQKVIDFLGSGNTILTSTFHGLYWSLLLGKKVICFPWSTKFFSLKYEVISADESSWQTYVRTPGKIPVYTEALEECRQLNQAYYGKVMNLLEG